MDPADHHSILPYTTSYRDEYTTSSDENHHEDKTIEEKDVLQMVTATIFSIIFALGIIGNGLVIWIAGFRMKKTISAVWFLHLAIADFLCCASLPLRIVQQIVSYSCLPSSFVSCLLNNILFYLNQCTSVLLLTAMSIDRWVSVMWPFWAKVHRTQKLVRITVAIIWGLSLICTGIMFSLTFLFYSRYNIEFTLHLIRLVFLFVIPFLIIVTSYVTIFLQLRKSKRPQRSQRPYRIITAVILCFFICWAPYYCLLVFMYKVSKGSFYILDTVSSSLAYLNSCINPIIYVFMAQDFRHNFLRSIPFRVEKALSEPPDGPCGEGDDSGPTPTTEV
ncbi:hypothetical protein GDO81_021467 [Engystomops pustulosus]|uniref:G-protein coupled receptors family 1 profile domain-containing protein n=1 Tax=Engystomops pustulosus TaxID=76066 RepID=A0AAV6ZPY2_ENGPU|nr:hypothetical protein GDO81_021467 [Engystomops pustulosus]